MEKDSISTSEVCILRPGLFWFKSFDLNHDLNHDLNRSKKSRKKSWFFYHNFFVIQDF